MKIDPFKPLFCYNNIEMFVSPPYDTLLDREIQELRSRDHNILQLFSEDGVSPSIRLQKWIKEGILREDSENSFIVLQQRFLHNGERYDRIGVIGVIDISDKQTGLKPHEMTFSQSVEQRRKIFLEVGSQMEPLFVLTPEASLERILFQFVSGNFPDMEFQEPVGVLNRVYHMRDLERIKAVQAVLSGQTGIVADGHHRLKAIESINRDYHRNYRILAYVTSMFSNSIFLSGINRVIKKGPGAKDAINRLRSYFDLVPDKRPTKRAEITFYDGTYMALIPNKSGWELMGKMGLKPEAVTCVSDLLILKETLGVDTSPSKGQVEFTVHDHMAIDAVDSGAANFALLMPPWQKDQFISIVNSGTILPQKSTYFYPKIPAGMVLYRMKRDE
ncbi:MAG: DUF1015 family protein [Thermoplasmataceae archaeon]